MKQLRAVMHALVLMCAVGSVVTFGAPSVAHAQATSVAGEWDASMNTPGGAIPFKIIFKQDSAKLSGTVKRRNGDVPLEGTIKGKDVKFSYTIVYNDNPLILSITATVTGDAMKGMVSFAGQAEEEFSATRAKAP